MRGSQRNKRGPAPRLKVFIKTCQPNYPSFQKTRWNGPCSLRTTITQQRSCARSCAKPSIATGGGATGDCDAAITLWSAGTSHFCADLECAPAPCREKPDTGVAFGEAVRSMEDHMQAAGLRTHMTNPLLLQEILERFLTSEQYASSSRARNQAYRYVVQTRCISF